MKKIVKKSSRKAPARQYVVVRTYSAGVDEVKDHG